jgi:hypothetical protein
MMKRTLLLNTLLLTFLLTLTSYAQDLVEAPKPRVSPVAISKTMLGDIYIKVVYGQPQKKNRVVFGELVPFGQVWRTGANEATEIHFTSPVSFSGKKVDVGLYALFTIPGKDTWTIILNKGLGQSGSFQYDEKLDVVRVEVPVNKSNKIYEAFTLSFSKMDDGVSLAMNWDDVVLTIPIKKAD